MSESLKIELSPCQAAMLRKILRGCTNHPCQLAKGAGPEHVNGEVKRDLKSLAPDKVRRKWQLYGETLVAVKYMTKRQWNACLDVAIQAAQDDSE